MAPGLGRCSCRGKGRGHKLASAGCSLPAGGLEGFYELAHYLVIVPSLEEEAEEQLQCLFCLLCSLGRW